MNRRDFLVGGGIAALGYGLLATGPRLVAPAAAQSLSAPLTEADRADLRRAEAYLNGIDTMYSRFRQTASNGTEAGGFIALDRPNHMRFEYDAPNPVVMIADGYELTYFDRELKEARQLPTFETPLWFLLRDHISFEDSGLDVLWVKQNKEVLVVRLAQKDKTDQGTVNVVFAQQPFSFRGWEIVDAAGVSIQVALQNPRFGVTLDPDMFDEKKLPGFPSHLRSNR
ncbi:Outer membrane lipoprotein-sorting protein [Tistlia consotensis]|uniref:Outer membrane lipoprotein-sorting protein n=1 Tax=Tistlia consotensis USBA 355 TaxID=560819 RepID=A0A1Y6BG61_9PROT|nr:outer membrane lipoprotein carrier protein LolA [Tistlia consotensis]SMF09431.1 Outer membrane lipoprotein-sorting protein [Tistlia consotensis USBA 355]SNR34536.1 Outer membrane lipoprotein-sorting protein [Tistlia consotensis]